MQCLVSSDRVVVAHGRVTRLYNVDSERRSERLGLQEPRLPRVNRTMAAEAVPCR